MKYIELKSIIKHVKRHIPCPECTALFKEKDINVIGLIQDSALLSLTCPSCNHHTIIQVSLLWNGSEKSYKHNTVGLNKNPITENDVLDMKNFLKDFNGDFREYLKNI